VSLPDEVGTERQVSKTDEDDEECATVALGGNGCDHKENEKNDAVQEHGVRYSPSPHDYAPPRGTYHCLI